ncbi:MAG TPA: hypothetical protein VE981_09120 [Planctomycetota bacterium]|nr:hypothetical protein [Planctomycetota bacterium]
MKRLPWLLLLLAAGCTSTPPPASKSTEIRLVAILPFFNETGGSSFDAEEFGGILASEFVKAWGVRVVRPAHLRAASSEPIVTVEDAVRVARTLGADAVLACAVTDYDPYDPPRIGVHVQLLRTEGQSLSAKDLDGLLQSASWKKGPLAMTPAGAAHAIAAFERVYDAREAAVRAQVAGFAQRLSIRPSEVLAVQSRYLQFVSTQILQRAYGS